MRKAGSSREATWPMICRAGVDLLYRHGFEAMNLRELAKAAGFRGKGSLYNYFESKEDFLFILMCDVMEEILRDLESNVGPVEGPLERMKAFVRFHIEWHTARREETFISHMEMRSLKPEHYATYIALRKRYEQFFADIIVAGCRSGEFRVSDVPVIVQSTLSMLTSVCNWYHRGGRVSQEELVAIHVRMVLAILNVDAVAESRQLSASRKTEDVEGGLTEISGRKMPSRTIA